MISCTLFEKLKYKRKEEIIVYVTGYLPTLHCK